MCKKHSRQAKPADKVNKVRLAVTERTVGKLKVKQKIIQKIYLIFNWMNCKIELKKDQYLATLLLS